MKLISTDLKDLIVIEPKVFSDLRGCFFEAYNHKAWLESHLDINFLQDNISLSKKGVLRGLHMQIGSRSQAKLVSVLDGEVLDVAVDLRRDSPTFLKHYSIKLSGENRRQLFIPRGFAHGFLVLSSSATFFYKCDNYYCRESEVGIIYNDPQLQINWGIDETDMIISEKDSNNKKLSEVIGIV